MAGESRVTSAVVLVEEQGAGIRATEMVVLSEIGAIGVYATSMVVLVEMELFRPCKPTTRYFYGGVELTPYANAVDVRNMPRELAAKTLGSTGEEYKAGISEYAIGLKGDWSPVVDRLLGADILRGQRRSSEVIFDDCDAEVSYAWEEAYVSQWAVSAPARGKLEWSATLRHNGAGVRTVS